MHCRLASLDDLAFQIVHNGQDKVNLRASSPRACHAWMRAIESARQECVAAVVRELESTSLAHLRLELMVSAHFRFCAHPQQLRSRRDSRRDSKASRRSSIGVGY